MTKWWESSSRRRRAWIREGMERQRAIFRGIISPQEAEYLAAWVSGPPPPDDTILPKAPGMLQRLADELRGVPITETRGDHVRRAL